MKLNAKKKKKKKNLLYTICLSKSIHSSGTIFFSYLASQKVTLSILPTHFTKYPATMDLF